VETLTLDGLLAAWGQKDSQYDMNSDGIVNVDDLLAYINGLSNDQAATPQSIPQEAHASAPDVTETSFIKRHGGLAGLVDTLFDRLAGAGFDSQPPTNIRDLVAKLGLNGRETDHVMQRLSQRYPRGLGVNALG
jgi:hypothetical protein